MQCISQSLLHWGWDFFYRCECFCFEDFTVNPILRVLHLESVFWLQAVKSRVLSSLNLWLCQIRLHPGWYFFHRCKWFSFEDFTVNPILRILHQGVWFLLLVVKTECWTRWIYSCVREYYTKGGIFCTGVIASVLKTSSKNYKRCQALKANGFSSTIYIYILINQNALKRDKKYKKYPVFRCIQRIVYEPIFIIHKRPAPTLENIPTLS